MRRRWKATIATGVASVALALSAGPAAAHDGAKVKADTDPSASAKLHLGGGQPTMIKVN